MADDTIKGRLTQRLKTERRIVDRDFIFVRPDGEVVVIKAGTALDLLAPDGPITVETLQKPGQ